MRFPADTDRHSIFGMTGSGKTVFALWCLSRRSYPTMPWIIIDFKCDENIAAIPGLKEISITAKPPKHPGLYVVRPMPHEEEEVDAFLWRIWERGRTGVYIDEGYMIGRFNKALRAILTQGRSKRIPVITLSQRPAWISPFILSESEFISTFFLHTKADVDRVREWVPGVREMPRDFCSYYWSVKDRELQYLAPVPPMAEILNRFDLRRPRRRFL